MHFLGPVFRPARPLPELGPLPNPLVGNCRDNWTQLYQLGGVKYSLLYLICTCVEQTTDTLLSLWSKRIRSLHREGSPKAMVVESTVCVAG